MTRRTRQKKRFEFSKVVAVIGVTMWVLVNLFALAMIALTLDLSPLAYVIGSVDAVVAVVLGFYYWKAKAENQIKLRQIYRDLAREVEKEAPPDGYESWGN